MDKIRFLEKIKDFEKAVLRLHEAFLEPETSLARDGIIQRFEFCYELAWKAMKLYLESKDIDVRNAKDTLKEAFQQGLIQEADAWTAMHHYRNMTSHTYDEALALEVFHFIKKQALILLDELAKKLSHFAIAL